MNTNGNRWTRESIIEAIQKYVSQTGEPPGAELWKTSGWWPSYNAVRRHFGSWGEAIRAAGAGDGRPGHFRLNKSGRRPTCEQRFLVQWQRSAASRTVRPIIEAQQRALLDPELRDLVLGQIIQDSGSRSFPQLFPAAPEIPLGELDFETGVEYDFQPWLVAVMDFHREIDDWAA